MSRLVCVICGGKQASITAFDPYLCVKGRMLCMGCAQDIAGAYVSRGGK
jgi:hypothetical protein